VNIRRLTPAIILKVKLPETKLAMSSKRAQSQMPTAHTRLISHEHLRFLIFIISGILKSDINDVEISANVSIIKPPFFPSHTMDTVIEII
jgi:hypothetical protein